MGERANDKQVLPDGMPVTAEKTGFEATEMIACGKCARKNPPTRLQCFYCGAELAISDERASTLAPNLRQMEAWEKGFNIILKNNAADVYREENIVAAARLLKQDPQELKSVLQKGCSLPVARSESQKEAEIICTRL